MTEKSMKTISIIVDEEILQAADTLSRTLGMTLSAFTEHAFRLALRQQRIKTLEEQHRQGYLKQPVEEGEFSVWEDEQIWSDECKEERYAGIHSKNRIKEDPC